MTAALRPAAFLDRDGVINVDHGYVHRPDQLDWIPGAPAAIARLNRLGYLVIVVTNQAGVARGYYDEAQIGRFHGHLSDQLRAFGAHVDAFYYAPHHHDAVIETYRHPDHPDRKPNPGMINRAAAEWGVDRDRSFLIGDKQSDMDAARAAGVPGHLFERGDLDVFVSAILAGR